MISTILIFQTGIEIIFTAFMPLLKKLLLQNVSHLCRRVKNWFFKTGNGIFYTGNGIFFAASMPLMKRLILQNVFRFVFLNKKIISFLPRS